MFDNNVHILLSLCKIVILILCYKMDTGIAFSSLIKRVRMYTVVGAAGFGAFGVPLTNKHLGHFTAFAPSGNCIIKRQLKHWILF